MDPQLLSQAFLATLDPDASTRNAAESHLATCAASPYVLTSCLALAKEVYYPIAVQQASAVFLKNLILRHWKTPGVKNHHHVASLQSPEQQNRQQLIQQQASSARSAISSQALSFSATARTEFKIQLLFSLSQVTPEVQLHLLAIVAKILAVDLPCDQWPEFLPTVLSMFREPSLVYTGVLCSLQLFRYYGRLKPHQRRQQQVQYEAAIAAIFPILYQIATSAQSSEPPLALWKVVKCYSYVVEANNDIPTFLQRDIELENWLSLFLDILKRPVGAVVTDSATSGLEKQQHQQEDYQNQQSQQKQQLQQQQEDKQHKHTLTNSSAQSFGSPIPSTGSEDCREGDSIQLFAWMKCKKWSCHVLMQLMTTACSHLKSSEGACNVPFNRIPSSEQALVISNASIFLTYFAPEVCRVFIKEIQQWHQTTPLVYSSFLSIDRALIDMFTYLELAQTVPDLWSTVLLPNMNSILSNLIFQTLLLTPNDIDLIHNQPDEYITMNVENSQLTPRAYSRRLFVRIMKFHADEVLNGFFQFINEIIAKYHENRNDYTLAVQKDAVLQLMAAIRRNIIGKGTSGGVMELFTHQMESFLVHHVSLDTSSQYAFLRARACEVIAAFGKFEMSLSDLKHVYEHIVPRLADPELVVQFQAVMAIQQLTHYPYIHTALADPQQVSGVMACILKIYGSGIESERLSLVMADLIQDYSEQLTPFAADVAKQLTDQFVRIASEVIARGDENEGYMDNKNMAASGILDTLYTLVVALGREKNTELRPTLLSVFSVVLSNAQEDYYQEVFDLIELMVQPTQQQQSSQIDDGNFLNQLCGFMQVGTVTNPSHAGEYFIPLLCTLIEADKTDALCTESNTKFFFELSVRYASAPGEYRKRGIDFSQLIIIRCCKPGRAFDYVNFYISQLLDMVPLPDVLEIFVAAVYFNPVDVSAYLANTGRLAPIVHEHLVVFGRKFTKPYEKKIVASGLLKLLSTLPQNLTLERHIAYDLVNVVAKYVIELENLPLKTELELEQFNCSSGPVQFQFVDSGLSFHGMFYYYFFFYVFIAYYRSSNIFLYRLQR